ncbi:MAG TPA: hypothetical protein VIF09_25950 [Polyangiaceae bacterium]|jgi:hypothetical protein
MRPALPLLLAVTTVVAGAALSHTSRAESPSSRPLPAVEVRRPPVAAVPRFELVDDSTQTLPTFAHEGRRFVLGSVGQRYRLHIVNPTGARVEAVIAVDGLDAIDGRSASLAKRGYVIPAFGDVTIDGWRTSMDTVAAFRFSAVRDSFAAQQQNDRNVGVVGVAFFRERPPVVWQRPRVAWGDAPGTRGASGSAGAPAPSAASPKGADDRSGLGTQFAESHDSRVEETTFVRADAGPSTVAELRYDDRAGLVARGIRLAPQRWGEQDEVARRDAARPFPDTRFAQPPR